MKYTFSGKILTNEADTNAEIVDISGVRYPDEVPIYLNEDEWKRIGTAGLTKFSNHIWAEIHIVENGYLPPKEVAMLADKLYPHVCGTICEKNGNTVTKCDINSISISYQPNLQPSIKCLATFDMRSE